MNASRWIGLLFLLFSLIFLSIGMFLAWQQQDRVRRFVPVPAEVVSKRMDTSRSSKGGTSYTPVVEYRYEVSGRSYTSDQTLPVSMSSSRGWAQSILDRFEPGQRVEAYHDPDDPSKAFLLREAMFLPYLFLLLPMAFVLIGVVVLVHGPAIPSPAALGKAEAGPHALLPLFGIARKRSLAALCTTLWWGVGIAAFAHYLWVAETPDTFSRVAGIVYFGAGLLPAGAIVWFWRLSRTVRDPRVTLARERVLPGESFEVEVEQAVRPGLRIERIDLALVCEQKTRERTRKGWRHVTRSVFEERRTLEGDDLAAADDQAIRASTVFAVPADAEPSTAAKGPVQIAWKLDLRTHVPGGPDYRASFPIRVVSGA